MSWLSEKGENHCTDYDIFVYGLYCTPCLFGENAEQVKMQFLVCNVRTRS